MYLLYTPGKMTAQKGHPLSKAEVMGLLELVANTPTVFSKGNHASNNRLKDAAWIDITKKYNTAIGSSPRKPEQLRLKWENLKKGARKRSHKIKMNYKLQRSGDKPEKIPPDEVLDKVSAILGESLEFNGTINGDAIQDAEEFMEDIGYKEGHIAGMPFTRESIDSLEAQSQPKTSKNMFFFDGKDEGKLKSNMSNKLKESIIRRNIAIAEYYESKKRNEEELFHLHKRKLELEILNINRINENDNESKK